MKELSQLEDSLGISFRNKDLLQQAFVHRSYLNEHPDFELPHNERLEFLGDAVLELIVTEDLYRSYPKEPEGVLTSWRAALVNAKMLAQVAGELGFGDYLLLSRGEGKGEGKGKDYMLANTMEAFIGAFFLDRKLKACEKFIGEHILSKLPLVLEQKLFMDGKSRFQELSQEKLGITPTYKVLKEWGPDHAKHFQIGVHLEEKLVAKGEGSSKQEGEESAARNAIQAKGWEI
ncbi:MAG: ribonuclease III [Patescibacteria group bacterium]